MIGVWVCGHEEVEEDGRDAGALRDTRPRVSLKGNSVVVSNAGHPVCYSTGNIVSNYLDVYDTFNV